MPDRGIARILITEDEIRTTVARLGAEITASYKGMTEELMVIGLLRGSFVFMAVSTYGDGTVSSGDVKVAMDLDESIEGRDILLVEDIVDTGNTFSKIIRMMNNRNPRSVKVCTFLDKPSRRTAQVDIDFCGITIPNEFVCGYGLDYAQRYRNLPYVGVLQLK